MSAAQAYRQGRRRSQTLSKPSAYKEVKASLHAPGTKGDIRNQSFAIVPHSLVDLLVCRRVAADSIDPVTGSRQGARGEPT